MSNPRLDKPTLREFDYAPPGCAPEHIGLVSLFRDSCYGVLTNARRFYETPMLEYVYRRVTPGGVYLDVGGNIGNHAVYFAKWMADHVVTIEPHGDLRQTLSDNLTYNGVAAKCTILPYFVGDAAELGRKSDDVQRGPLLARGFRSLYWQEVEDVEMTTIDALVFHAPPLFDVERIALLKVDTDGHDDKVLRGASRTLLERRPVVVVEAWYPELERRVRTCLAEHHYVVDEASRGLCATPTLLCWPEEAAQLGGVDG